MRILVVDDVIYVRQYLDRELTQNGHSVLMAASGMQAIEILKQDLSIRVVITDLLMPGMDGLDLFRTVKDMYSRDETGTLTRPVFYLMTAVRPDPTTTNRQSDMLVQALKLGFAEVLLK